MSFTKKILVAIVSVTLVFVVGCGSQETSRKEETKPAVEQKAETGTQELQPQTVCPVMGGQIDKSLYVDNDGKRIYICCGHCREELTENFDEQVKKLAELGQKPEIL